MSGIADAQVHTHGQGQALVAQEANQWVIELNLPAADILGFEHAPETEQQKQAIKELKKAVQDSGSFIALPSHCLRVSVNLEIPSDGEHEHGDNPHKHDHDHHDSGETHGNVEILLEYRCQSSINSMSFPVLTNYSSLTSLSVGWITEKGQGAKTIDSTNPVIRL